VAAPTTNDAVGAEPVAAPASENRADNVEGDDERESAFTPHSTHSMDGR
jgi:hypothetical protein